MFTAKQENEILRLRREGHTLEYISSLYGVSVSPICQLCRNAGVKRERLIHHPSFFARNIYDRDAEIRRLRGQGFTLQKIGSAYGLCRERVRIICANGGPK